MPWKPYPGKRKGYPEGAFWVDPNFGLSGYPEDQPALEQASRRSDPSEAIVAVRDRVGFRYERRIGVKDYVSQNHAAQLVGVDIVTIVRWAGPRKLLPCKLKNGYVVIRVGDLLDLANRLGIPLTNMRGLLIVADTRGRTSEWVPTGGAG